MTPAILLQYITTIIDALFGLLMLITAIGEKKANIQRTCFGMFLLMALNLETIFLGL